MNETIDNVNFVQKPLKSSDWALFRLFNEYLLGLTIKSVCDAIPEYFTYNDSASAQKNHCSAFYEAVENINLSVEVDKIIIRKGELWKLANQEEYQVYQEDNYSRAMTYLKRYSASVKKARQDRQGKIISNQGVIIDEKSKAKPFHEAFNEPKKVDLTKSKCYQCAFGSLGGLGCSSPKGACIKDNYENFKEKENGN